MTIVADSAEPPKSVLPTRRTTYDAQADRSYTAHIFWALAAIALIVAGCASGLFAFSIRAMAGLPDHFAVGFLSALFAASGITGGVYELCRVARAFAFNDVARGALIPRDLFPLGNLNRFFTSALTRPNLPEPLQSLSRRPQTIINHLTAIRADLHRNGGDAAHRSAWYEILRTVRDDALEIAELYDLRQRFGLVMEREQKDAYDRSVTHLRDKILALEATTTRYAATIHDMHLARLERPDPQMLARMLGTEGTQANEATVKPAYPPAVNALLERLSEHIEFIIKHPNVDSLIKARYAASETRRRLIADTLRGYDALCIYDAERAEAQTLEGLQNLESSLAGYHSALDRLDERAARKLVDGNVTFLARRARDYDASGEGQAADTARRPADTGEPQ